MILRKAKVNGLRDGPFQRLRASRRRALCIAVAVLVTLLISTRLDSDVYQQYTSVNRLRAPPFASKTGDPLPSPATRSFWHDLVGVLRLTKPGDVVARPPEDWKWERIHFDPKQISPSDAEIVYDIIQLSRHQADEIRSAHAQFMSHVDVLAPRVPFAAGTRGIVMTADPHYMGVAITSILMLRRSGSKLPVELFLDSASPAMLRRCASLLEEYNGRCIQLSDFLTMPANATAPTFRFERFQYKALSLLFSSFQSILFMDADAFPLHNPDALLTLEPFTSHGLVVWPDFWIPTLSHWMWEVANTSQPERTTLDSRSAESSVMLMDKGTHASSLLLAVYYNVYGPDLWYWLQSQGGWGTGDKETFWLAATVLGNPMWRVKKDAEFLTPDGVWDGTGILQHDPVDDYRREMRVRERARRRAEGLTVTVDADEASDPQPRWLFIHLNRVKFDARNILKTVGEYMHQREQPEDRLERVWGPDSTDAIIHSAGFDVEKAVWEELLRVSCRDSILEECDKVRDFYEVVF